jgi:ADP-ribose pyrophosphatase YjhB (NUDIX family)
MLPFYEYPLPSGCVVHTSSLVKGIEVKGDRTWRTSNLVKCGYALGYIRGTLRMKNNIWIGASGVCMNSKGEILMVLQGKPEEEKRWSVPSGGIEDVDCESLESCCIREVFEETGYTTKVVNKLLEKQGAHGSIEYKVTYFEIEIIEGSPKIQDPDGLIHEISWKSMEQLRHLELSFPEDRPFLINYINNKLVR